MKTDEKGMLELIPKRRTAYNHEVNFQSDQKENIKLISEMLSRRKQWNSFRKRWFRKWQAGEETEEGQERTEKTDEDDEQE